MYVSKDFLLKYNVGISFKLYKFYWINNNDNIDSNNINQSGLFSYNFLKYEEYVPKDRDTIQMF